MCIMTPPNIFEASAAGCVRTCRRRPDNILYAIMGLKTTAVKWMQQPEEICEAPCTGTEPSLTTLKQSMLSEDKAVQLADIFKALGDPTRVKMIYALLQTGELCVHDLCELLNMTQSAISHQLRYLRNLRLVKRRKAGKTVYYSLDDHHIEQIFAQTLQHITHT